MDAGDAALPDRKHMEPVIPDELAAIVAYRLAVARAAQRDAMGWWDDQSLAAGADGLARRLFPRSASSALRRLALLAGRARHDQVFADEPDAQHLFFLGEDVEYRLDQVLDGVAADPPGSAPKSREALAEVLRALGPEPDALPVIERERGRLQLPADILRQSPVERARAFAWAYARGDGTAAAYPFAVADGGAQ